MKKIMCFIAMMAIVGAISAEASTYEREEPVRQLEAAIVEIQTTKSLIPKPFRRNLESALARLQYVQGTLLSGGSIGGAYFCSVESSFHNRVYTGRGGTELEAKAQAIDQCKTESRIFCDEETIQCERSHN